MEIKNLKDLLEAARKQTTRRVVALNGIDVNTLEALNVAVEMGIVTATLTGDRAVIEATCAELKIDPRNYEIIHATDQAEASQKAADLILEKRADILMKGMVSTDKFMKVLLRKEYGLVPSRNILSHVAVMESLNYHKLLIFSDAGVIPYPDLEQKIVMTGYLIKTARSLGIRQPKVAIIAPTEQILISIPSCMDGATIAKMSEHGQIEGGIVDGPMALDVAICREAAQIKGFLSPVAGDADCLLFPNIDAGNVFYKTNSKLCKAQLAGVIAGARVPAVVSSRGDSFQTKLNSIALASLMS
ncbi:MAG TPA: phosphate acyltransferase [Prolixibacteraceae bacterium]|nr:phosphate acyltransferase [Prolixibacteraceae bacterium]